MQAAAVESSSSKPKMLASTNSPCRVAKKAQYFVQRGHEVPLDTTVHEVATTADEVRDQECGCPSDLCRQLHLEQT